MRFKIVLVIRLLTIALCALFSKSALADTNCDSTLLNQLLSNSKLNYTKIEHQPSEDLILITQEIEVDCPWDSVADFNGDKKEDWIGVLQKDNQYVLVAYLSKFKQHYVQEIAVVNRPLSKVYLAATAAPSLSARIKDPAIIFRTKVGLEMIQINTLADIFAWDGKNIRLFSTIPY